MNISKRTGSWIAFAILGIIAVGCAPQEPAVVVEPGTTRVVHDKAPGNTIINNHPATPPVIVVPPASKDSNTKTDTTTTTSHEKNPNLKPSDLTSYGCGRRIGSVRDGECRPQV